MTGRSRMLLALVLVTLSVALIAGCGNTTDEAIEPLPDEGVIGGEILDGEALVAERCAGCHAIDRVESAGYDEVGWEATIDRMIEKGATLTEEEKAAVIAYLSSL